ncbi:RluA family pseudouridine synthase [Geothrix sp. PMB-07]|uniref:RluA family pseudouridine synthase n=1 Tax=Geothrix sp. PMB-07 TaxID=3068640 RepID=UPI0027409944|nr:RluA family pseudouridine synthase [Geothrix sp. PMB-07]WLT30340.1 RluA family pseudouridine synthase [Geothrix sp. PMB-07]
MTLRKWTFTVDPEDAELRLDQLIAKRTELSRRSAREALKLGGVQVDRKRVKVAGKVVKPGTEVRVAFDPDLPPVPDTAIPVVFEDAWILAVDKPAGIATQGTWASDRHDLLALLKTQRPDLKLALHHRLDQGTSGLLVLAKDPKANAGLAAAFASRDLVKLYLARISEPLEACTVEEAIGRIRGADPGRFGCRGDLMDPKSARTDFRPATAEETAGLVPGHWIVARIHTGRTHQIRVHLQHLGRPILGDALYGGAASDRLWLHAWRLGLKHPVTQEALLLEAPPIRFRR